MTRVSPVNTLVHELYYDSTEYTSFGRDFRTSVAKLCNKLSVL